jgi:hypothetical protein
VIASLTGQGINVQQALRTLGVSESGYYDWRGRPDSPTTLRRIWLAGEIADVHKASGGTYGWRAGSPPSCAMDGTSRSGTAPWSRSCARSGSRGYRPAGYPEARRSRRSSRLT